MLYIVMYIYYVRLSSKYSQVVIVVITDISKHSQDKSETIYVGESKLRNNNKVLTKIKSTTNTIIKSGDCRRVLFAKHDALQSQVLVPLHLSP
jgi:hypothetical protein